jgi:hypothetical protein
MINKFWINDEIDQIEHVYDPKAEFAYESNGAAGEKTTKRRGNALERHNLAAEHFQQVENALGHLAGTEELEPHKGASRVIHSGSGELEVTFKGVFGQPDLTKTVGVTKEQYEEWRDGALIQDAMGNLSEDDREMFLTGNMVWPEHED